MSFTVYKSSAGSGKTFTLVKEYLKLALTDLGQFSQILAVTFTNKAATEMKERILENLEIISHYNRPKESQTPTVIYLLPELVKETGLSKDQLAQRSEKLLGMILHNFSDFAIGTIDSFVHKIVRTFAQDLKIAINFQVELDGAELLRQTIDLLLEQVGYKEDLTQLLIEFIRDKTEEEKSWHIENELNQFAETLLKEDSYTFMEELRTLDIQQMNQIRKRINKELRSTDQLFQERAKDIMEEILREGIVAKDFYQGARGIFGFIDKLSKLPLHATSANSYVYTTINEGKWHAAKASESSKANIDMIKGKIIHLFDEYLSFKEKHWNKYLLQKEALQKMYGLSVLSEIEKLMHEIKLQQNTVHISEFNKRIADIVFYEPIPFIYERLGEKYKHFLIDEFQDTSILQWRNLIPLIDNSLAEGAFNMVVGDGKQAIYRWRNGEVSQFRDLPFIYQNDGSELMNLREDSLRRNYEEKLLEKNFRSKAELVDFNNRFFDYCKGQLSDESKKIYDNQAQQFNADNTGGYINITFTEKEDKEEIHLDIALKKINSILEQGYALNDIAILCRGNRTANLLAAHLLESNIPVISEESLLIAPRPKVRLIIALMHLIADPNNIISATEVIVLLSQMHSEHHLIGDCLLEFASYRKESKVQKPCWDFLETFLLEKGIHLQFEELEQYPLYEMVEQLIRCLKLDQEPNAYLITLLDEVHKYTESMDNAVTDFLSYYNRMSNTISVTIPEGIDAIRVMTIHKSKGLEFPVVIFPFAWQEEKIEIDEHWFDWKEIDEELPVARIKLRESLSETALGKKFQEEKDKSRLDLINLIYVAFTRARNSLYIITAESKRDVSIYNLLLNFLDEESISPIEGKDNEYEIGTLKKNVEQLSRTSIGQAKLSSFVSRKGNILFADTAPIAWSKTSSVEAIKKGELLHALLEDIQYSDDLDIILEQAIFKGSIQKEEKEEIQHLFKNLFQHPKAAEWFSRAVQVFNEQEIIVPAKKNDETSRPELHRPDRIVKSNGKTIVIDYKTGQKSMTHISQILRYKHLLQDMGESNVSGYLIYLGDQIVVDGPH